MTQSAIKESACNVLLYLQQWIKDCVGSDLRAGATKRKFIPPFPPPPIKTQFCTGGATCSSLFCLDFSKLKSPPSFERRSRLPGSPLHAVPLLFVAVAFIRFPHERPEATSVAVKRNSFVAAIRTQN